MRCEAAGRPHKAAHLAAAAAASGAQLVAVAAASAAQGVAQAASLADVASYVPSPMEPGWEVWVGAVAGVVPFVIASLEFGKRIVIQRRCAVCSGRGLVQRGQRLRKCPVSGGLGRAGQSL